MNEEKVVVFGLSGEEKSLNWPEIKGIALEVQPASYGSNIYWHMLGTDGDLSFPMEAEGQAEALQFFQTLPGFDNNKVFLALRSSKETWLMAWVLV